MDLATILGLVISLVTIMVVMILDGGSPAELFSVPQAILLIVAGSLSASVTTVPLSVVVNLPKYILKAVKGDHFDFEGSIEILAKMADKARREGLLALEEESKKISDPFLQKGVMLVVDGTDPEQVEAILYNNIEHMRERHKQGYGFFAAAGAFAPTFGIIGTVMGLINVLKELDNAAKLASSIAAAFLATLWGLLMANVFYLPLSGKLKSNDEEETAYRTMLMEGILGIQAGENPRLLKDKLMTYLPPKLVAKLSEDGEPAGKKTGKVKSKAEAEA